MMASWLEEIAWTLRSYARDVGLDGVEFYGREGWRRALARYGWKQEMVLISVGVNSGGDRG